MVRVRTNAARGLWERESMANTCKVAENVNFKKKSRHDTTAIPWLEANDVYICLKYVLSCRNSSGIHTQTVDRTFQRGEGRNMHWSWVGRTS